MSKDRKECEKCKKLHYCDEHHVLPKGIFGEGDTVFLCKNCHDKFHRYLGHKYLRKLNKRNEEFYFYKYYAWLAGLCIVIGFIILSLNY